MALQLIDSTDDTEIGVTYVTVNDVAPTVDAGPNQTVPEGTTVTFAGTASDPGGSGNPLQVAWDFNYDGSDFNADASANGVLNPSYVYSTPGTYTVALQATDQFGLSSLATMVVTVTDVAPTATVTNSSPTPEGSAVTFTVSNLVDQTPGDTPSILADWTGSGQFQLITSDQLIQNADGSESFTYVYETASDASGYPAVIQIADSYGGYTNYTQNVVVTVAAPTDDFGPSGGFSVIDPTTPFVFTNVTDPSTVQQAAGFTYYVSVDGGNYTASTSTTFQLPSGITVGVHTVSGYVLAQDGGQSSVITWTGTVTDAEVSVLDTDSGEMQLDWTGDSGPVDVDPGATYDIAGTAPGLTITLLSSGADYQIYTNDSIAQVTTESGVTDVTVSVNTNVDAYTLSQAVGNGDVNEIDLPAGSTVSVNLRGDLGNLIGNGGLTPSTGVTAGNLLFGNLTGSITGLNYINNLTLSGWLGESGSSSVVDSNTGIGTLTAFGVGANVNSDLAYNINDTPMKLTVGPGGVPGQINAGNLGDADIQGYLVMLTANQLAGNLQFDAEGNIKLGYTSPNSSIVGVDGKLVALGGVTQAGTAPADNTLNSIGITGTLGTLQTRLGLVVTNNMSFGSLTRGTINGKLTAGSLDANKDGKGLVNLTVTGTMTINGAVTAPSIGTLTARQGLTAASIIVAKAIGTLQVTGTMKVTGAFTAGAIDNLTVSKDLIATITMQKDQNTPEAVGLINVTGDFTGSVGKVEGQQPARVSQLLVGGTFTSSRNTTLVNASGIGTILVTGNIGTSGFQQQIASQGSIDRIESSTESIWAGINAGTLGSGSIGQVIAQKTLAAAVIATNGNIGVVTALAIQGNITAQATKAQAMNTKPNIGFVSAQTILKTVTIHADWGIGSINATAPGFVPGFTVEAQCGVQFTVATLQFGDDKTPLQINVPASRFGGKVSFTAANNPLRTAGIKPEFGKDAKLLQTKEGAVVKIWSIMGPMNGATTLNNVTFVTPENQVFKLVKPTQLSNNAFSIKEP